MYVRPALQKTCPECSAPFQTNSRAKMFCCAAHQAAFHRRQAQRGRIALPFVQVWRMGKRGRTNDTAYAQEQLSKLADRWNAEDRKAGRRPDLIVSGKRATGWQESDLDMRRRG